MRVDPFDAGETRRGGGHGAEIAVGHFEIDLGGHVRLAAAVSDEGFLDGSDGVLDLDQLVDFICIEQQQLHGYDSLGWLARRPVAHQRTTKAWRVWTALSSIAGNPPVGCMSYRRLT